MRRLALCGVSISLLAGCATQGVSTANYTPAEPVLVKNEKTTARPQSVVWDELVRELAKSFYVINNIERESRIINVSFNSNSPSEYVNCGRTRRTYTEGDKLETFEYAVADKARYKAAGTSRPRRSVKTYAIFTREPSLEGRSNIYVAPDPADPGKTVVSVNTRYVVTIRVGGDSFVEAASGQIVSQASMRDSSFSYIFNTNKSSTTADAGGVTVVCSGTGRLETDILNMIR